ncbi:hypothetical protein HFP57_05215 [Parasphingopyxis algicola]|uniref:hypothetical protein n=1 Tax=Parasphingopyxis algicola TaxID=2026624 RepID=UPI0015A0073E|nr:hypothetical protein [Parasphingopyxis algicola]QLC24479.1 hypothetical protein HFP57_05215 [Parasphingopyxis algicola]
MTITLFIALAASISPVAAADTPAQYGQSSERPETALATQQSASTTPDGLPTAVERSTQRSGVMPGDTIERSTRGFAEPSGDRTERSTRRTSFPAGDTVERSTAHSVGVEPGDRIERAPPRRGEDREPPA